ncbi:MAG: hypothetical protein RLZZ488_1849 [Pseudomonadota bacterium]|jgi:leucyl/phenylalanyl-tRNA--protein transferase
MDAQELSAEILILAYAQGCFPMPAAENSQIIHWYRPDPRAIIPIDMIHVSQSMKRELRRRDISIRIDGAFEDVMRACAERPDTWISDEFVRAYGELHRLGFAHSLEVLREGKMVGGIYGVTLGSAFFAESMFHHEKNMSKLALIRLAEHLLRQGYTLLECQFLTDHLRSLGAVEIDASKYMDMLNDALKDAVSFVP